MAKRKDWIDALRGLAMLFVIYGHILMEVRPYSLFTSPIKLPLFFAVSGYVFSFKGGDTKVFLKGLLRHLALPWLSFSIVYTVVKIVTGTAVSEAVLDFVSGNVAWYIPCLIAAEILFFAILKLVKPVGLQCAAMMAISTAGYFVSKIGPTPTDFAGRAMIVQSFMMIGWIFRHLEARITRPQLWPAVFGLVYAAVGAYVLIRYKSSIFDVQSNSYYNPVLCALMIALGCGFLFYYARYVKMPKWLVFVGRNTLIFYLFHGRILDMMRPLVNLIPYELRSNVLTGLPISLGICVMLCGVCALCCAFINRYIPFLAGKSSKKPA